MVIPRSPPSHLGSRPNVCNVAAGGLKQEAIEEPRIPLSQGVQGMREGKHTVEIGNREQLPEAGFHPAHFGEGLALGTVAVVARAIADDVGSTGITLRELASQHRRAAGHDVLDHPALASREAMRLLVGVAIGTQDLRDLHPRSYPRPAVRERAHTLGVPKPGIIQ
jgi:hypothetical protein